MLLRIGWNPFNKDEDQGPEMKQKLAMDGSYEGSMAVGLRILVQISHEDSNIVVKSRKIRKLSKPMFKFGGTPSSSRGSCFLKSCYLCNKRLCPDKDVYMYRGDQGFCSVECRTRQIYLDEIRELEASTKKVLESYRQRRNGGRCETSVLLEEHRHRHEPLSHRKDRAIFSFS
ncbi:hypothetical protein RJ640_008349 [Escallonia rubra]|uniref:FLZ-type domain-containing protein n=1 Tax=Escallonia rubra TaxID=112253 RepID=A0AA88QG79_9ASTE|nr:hypothetical protein RJ640_008349 [Escallonia rubra]